MTSAPKPYGPIPTERQLLWHKREYYGFIHFSPNTFTNKEWGYGDESPEIFNPTAFDADQIVGTAAKAGMNGLILTCKHHDGFCLWPSKYTDHSVKNSPWKNGKGDMVREISDACKAHGIGFGTYLSPWDRNHPDYGTPAYLTYFRNQLEELTTEYGELFEVWFDGANGGDGYYGGANETRSIDRTTYYDWDNTWEIVRRNQPNAVMFSDAGPDIRWVGNEDGIAGEPCWSTISKDLLFPGIDSATFKTKLNHDMVDAWDCPQAMLNAGDRRGSSWLPAECDVSIRPGWFYHAEEDDRVRTPENLMDLYFKSVGRGASFLLNLPPDRRGMIHENDVESLMTFKELRETLFEENLVHKATHIASNFRGHDHTYGPENLYDGSLDTYWSTDDDITAPEIIFEFTLPTEFRTVELREYLPLGQRVNKFAIDIDIHDEWELWSEAEAIGSRRLIHGDAVTVSRVRLRIIDSPVSPALSAFGLYGA